MGMKTAMAVVLSAALVATAFAVPTADAASRKKKSRAAPPAAEVIKPPVDRFMACDVRVRDYLREGGAAVRVKKVDIDDARLQLSIQHEYGEAGKTNRRYLRGESEDDMRKNLNGILDEFNAAADAASAGRAWYVIAARTVMTMPEPREGSAENT